MRESRTGEVDRLERSLHAYHDGELGGFARWRFERRLVRDPELRRELDALASFGELVRESERQADSSDLWDGIALRLPAIDARRGDARERGPAWLDSLSRLRRPVGAMAAVALAAVAVALGWWFEAPSVGGGVVRWMDSGGRSVMVLEDDAESQTTIIWLLEGATEGAARGGRNGIS